MSDPNEVEAVSESTARERERAAHYRGAQWGVVSCGYDWESVIMGQATAEALRRYPEPVTLSPREARYPVNGYGYRWNERIQHIERFAPLEQAWHQNVWGVSAAWLDFANDLRAWPLVDQSGRPCRRESDGTISYRGETA